MKYLRRFNESHKFEILDLIEGRLAYLIDEGFNIKFINNGKNICFYRESLNRHHPHLVYTSEPFSWEEIKNYFIPLLIDYNNSFRNGKYSISLIAFQELVDNKWIGSIFRKDTKEFNELLNDKIDGLEIIDNIQIVLNI